MIKMRVDIGFTERATIIDFVDDDGYHFTASLKRWGSASKQAGMIMAISNHIDVDIEDIKMDKTGLGLPVWMEMVSRNV